LAEELQDLSASIVEQRMQAERGDLSGSGVHPTVVCCVRSREWVSNMKNDFASS